MNGSLGASATAAAHRAHSAICTSTAIARGSGIDRAITIDNALELDRRMPEINTAPGPYFIRLRVDAEQDYTRPPSFSYEGPEMKYRFGRAMEKKLGIKVFGPTGF